MMWLLIVTLCCDARGHLDHIRPDAPLAHAACDTQAQKMNAAWREIRAKVIAHCEPMN